MKFRDDFVTNSSSSSFICVFGVENDREQVIKTIETKEWERNILIGSEIKENWDNLKSEFTSSWFGCDAWCDKSQIEDDKYYFVYFDSEELLETDEYNCYDGYDEEEIESHEKSVEKELESVKGFDFSWDFWEGRNG